jgi:glycosyltransferase involved in cell wall biosynthesis
MSNSDAVPVVSVILPAFNRLHYLRLAVDSVLAQTLTDWELIIADDGSDEATQQYLRGLQNQARIKVIWLLHSGNPSAVRNAALREAQGEYIAFLDSDDLWMPSKLARQVAVLQAGCACRWVYTGYVRVDEMGEITTYPGARQWTPCSGAIVGPLLRLEVAVATATVLVDRHLLAKVGGFDEELLMFEHYDLWLRLCIHSDVELIDEPLTRLRTHSNHYSQAGIPMLTGRRLLLEKFLGRTADPRVREVAAHLRQKTGLQLANLQSSTDRRAALKTLAADCPASLTSISWWSGVLRLLAKMSVPRRLLSRYRRRTALAESA